MGRIEWAEYKLLFGFTARTSREVMTSRSTWFMRRPDASAPGGYRYAEANYFGSLAPEPPDCFLAQLQAYCSGTLPYEALTSSAVRCGADMLRRPLPVNAWTRGECGIAINGLIWMADKHSMARQIAAKLDDGFKVLKLKIGGIDFDDEIELLRMIRRQFPASELEIRLDANGSFSPDSALERLERLAEFSIHSIEQPVKAGQPELMATLCGISPVAIALDEELIGLRNDADKAALLHSIKPAYIILKPSLCGGLDETARWQQLADSVGVGHWITSALESSIGLYHIAAFAACRPLNMPQGLGTGQIYTNNIPSCLQMRGARLYGGAPDFDQSLLNSLVWR